MRFGFGIGLTNNRGGVEPPVITATTAPSLGTLTDGDTVSSAYSPGTYSSTAGTASSAVETVTINGSTGALSDTVSAGDVVSVTVLVADSAGSTRTFGAGTQTVAGIAPTASTAPTISGTIAPGETVTFNEGTYTGTTPITIIFTLTLDGVDVTADVVGSGYTIPAGTAGQSLVYTETASNGIAPDATQSVTEAVQAVASEYAYGFDISENVARLASASIFQNTTNNGFAFYTKIKLPSDVIPESYIFLLGVSDQFGLVIVDGNFKITNGVSFQSGSTTFTGGEVVSVFIRHDGVDTKMWTALEGGTAVLETSATRTYNDSGLSFSGVLWGGRATDSSAFMQGGEMFEGAYWLDYTAVSEAVGSGLIEGSAKVSDQPLPETWFDGKTGQNKAGTISHYKQFGPNEPLIFDGTDVPADIPDNFVVMRNPENGAPVSYDPGTGLVYWAAYDNRDIAGNTNELRLATSPDLAAWTDYGQIVPAVTGQSVSDFIFLGGEAGTHPPFACFYSTSDGGEAVINVTTSSDMTTWTSDVANPVFTNTAGPGNGIEDFRIAKLAENYWAAVYEHDQYSVTGARAVGAALHTGAVPLGASWLNQTDDLLGTPDTGFTTGNRYMANPSILRDGSTAWVFYEGVNTESGKAPVTLARKVNISSVSDIFNPSKYQKFGVVTWGDGRKCFSNCAAMESGVIYLYVQQGPTAFSGSNDGIAKIAFDPSNIREVTVQAAT